MEVIKEAELFFELQRSIGRIPFTQSKGWYEYLKHKNKNFKFFVDSVIDTKLALWGVEYYIPLIKVKILRIEGESFKSDLKEIEIINFYSKLIYLPYTGIEIDSSSIYSTIYEIGIRRAGFKRPIGSFSCPLTIEVDVTSDIKYNHNWKGNLKKARRKGLVFKEIVVVDQESIFYICQMFKEMADLKGLKYSLSPENLKKLVDSNEVKTFIVYDNKNKPLAARIVYLNKSFATDIFAANSNEARNTGATHYILYEGISLLKKYNIESLDLGRLPPSNSSSDGVFIFKNGIRGKRIQYCGEWSYYKNSIIEGMMYIYKNYFLKKQRY